MIALLEDGQLQHQRYFGWMVEFATHTQMNEGRHSFSNGKRYHYNFTGSECGALARTRKILDQHPTRNKTHCSSVPVRTMVAVSHAPDDGWIHSFALREHRAWLIDDDDDDKQCFGVVVVVVVVVVMVVVVVLTKWTEMHV